MSLFRREEMTSIANEITKAREADRFKKELKILLANAKKIDEKTNDGEKTRLISPLWHKLVDGKSYGNQNIRKELMIHPEISYDILDLKRKELNIWLSKYQQYIDSIED